MGIILWIIFGAFVGWVASLIMKTDAEQGTVLNIVVGIIGAVVGGWLMGSSGIGTGGGFNLYSLVVAIIGACVFIAVVKAFRR
ncbi:MAG: GlsB/YeaQ/YmgE family stress response membrane protein [Candidatus Vogelbacteria bacterium]|nr:GlsB/YeaQ/YmgE family stress response membrane protein [Candidatus Vogelbacteria bacterium]